MIFASIAVKPIFLALYLECTSNLVFFLVNNLYFWRGKSSFICDEKTTKKKERRKYRNIKGSSFLRKKSEKRWNRKKERTKVEEPRLYHFLDTQAKGWVCDPKLCCAKHWNAENGNTLSCFNIITGKCPPKKRDEVMNGISNSIQWIPSCWRSSYKIALTSIILLNEI